MYQNVNLVVLNVPCKKLELKSCQKVKEIFFSKRIKKKNKTNKLKCRKSYINSKIDMHHLTKGLVEVLVKKCTKQLLKKLPNNFIQQDKNNNIW